ncbi:hypothetical protein Afil01_37920 [Actinorhabdospora filicis]|uniref:Uncharacterized protein n=1 Tax=Actinorhabdospora filicis TaxID=1785913 RepID=A0A9W6SL49_9ACTN|nr:hypothetical protein Afil01_37920 [Actinorhabdospora filicis]
MLGPVAAHAEQRAVDDADDLGEADLGGGTRELVPAVGPAAAGDDAAPAQLEQDALQELGGDLLGGGDPLGADRVGSGDGELDGGAKRVVDARGQAHYGTPGGMAGMARRRPSCTALAM